MLKEVSQSIVSHFKPMLDQKPNARGEVSLKWASTILRSFEGDHPVCWMGFNAPMEIPLALGYLPFYPELVPGMLAAFDMSAGLVEMAEKRYLNMFCCSFHRCSLGAVTEGIWPKPTAFLGLSNVCDGQVKLFDFFGDTYGIKPQILDVPSTVNKTNLDYLEGQLRDIVAPLEELSGQKLTREGLAEAIGISNRLRQGLIRISELRKHEPSPFHGAGPLNALYTLVVQLWGLPGTPEIIDRLADEIEEVIQKGNLGEEKFRILLLGAFPTYKTELFNWLEKEMGANIVMSELTDVTWERIDEQDPFRGLARKIMDHPQCGLNNGRIEWALKVADDYNIDGVIHISHWGCRQTSGGVGVLRESFGNIGIPLMNLDVDLVDPRSYSAGQIYTRIQGFTEMLSQRKE